VRFIEDVEIDEWCAEHGIDPTVSRHDDDLVLCREYFGQAVHPRGQEARVARAAIESVGQWDECLLWITQWGIWGSSEDWPKYYAARGANGERRFLEKAPGHLFTKAEGDALELFLTLVLENAWDACVLAAKDQQTTARRVLVSHDEFVEVIERSDPPSNSTQQPTPTAPPSSQVR